MRLSFEYGAGPMVAEFPDNTDVFIPGETVADPLCIPKDRLVEKTLESICNPMGTEPLPRLAYKGSKVTIVFPDRVKGGEQLTSHRKISIKLILKELYDMGVEEKDILSIYSNGLHRKNAEVEIHNILGDGLFHEFWHSHQITNRDSEDYEHLADLGITGRGNPVFTNKCVYDSNVTTLIGHIQGNPYGGYSGGYKHCATGIIHWRFIASHHVPEAMYRKGFTPVSGKSLVRTKSDEIGQYMEKYMGRKFFCYDAVLGTESRQIKTNSGYAKVTQPYSWIAADKGTYVSWVGRKYDVMIFGIPQFSHYGEGMGTNPIMLMQTISAQVIRHKCIVSDNCVIICSSLYNGYSHDELWPYVREMYDMFQHDFMNTLLDMNRYGEYFATNEEYTRKYCCCDAFHPFHSFSMISCGHIMEMNTPAIYPCGAQEPGYARGMGLKTRVAIEETLANVKKKSVGQNSNILALPQTLKLGAVRLVIKDEVYEDKGQEDRGCACHIHGQVV